MPKDLKFGSRRALRIVVGFFLLMPLVYSGLVPETWPAAGATLLLELTFLVIARWAIYRDARSLTRRVHAASGQNWSVRVNWVEVDIISDMEYAAILRDVLLDPTVAMRQVWRTLRILVNLGCKLVGVIPVTAFWFVVAEITLSSHGLPQVPHGMPLSQLVGVMLKVSCAVGLAVLLPSLLTSLSMERSCYHEEIGR
ncbi:hypothetical protein CAL29_22890 [Bordetella genomosp. 10]|uniref:Uncharacterized protein n=1 Tax=Bordetella genomosp. 10 TaxID=1416804 RepID=A0A261S1F3_9BORD|nr:hypothetical protein [Bordetella genomosp. 10]OZI30827.1 hypothetical protein CAL29_22890 [Bordetella genomosp. 10]